MVPPASNHYTQPFRAPPPITNPMPNPIPNPIPPPPSTLAYNPSSQFTIPPANNFTANTTTIRKSRVNEFKNQMVTAQPSVKFGSSSNVNYGLNYANQVNQRPQLDGKGMASTGIYSQPLPSVSQTKTNVNFGSSQFNFSNRTSANIPVGGNPLPLARPSETLSNFTSSSFNIPNLSFPHLKGISEDKN